MSLSFGHGLELVHMVVHKRTSSGGWTSVNGYEPHQKYRFRLRFRDTNSTAYAPPFTEPHSHLELYSVEIKNASHARFYTSSAYSGSSSLGIGHATGTYKIFPGNDKYVYLYFEWDHNYPGPFLPVTITASLWNVIDKGKPQLTAPPFT